MGQDASDYEGHFANYAEYSKTFRSWMVAYGVGGPVLLLLSKDAPTNISGSPHILAIVTLFILGVAMQILLSLVNKWAAWQMYRGAFAKYQHHHADPDCDNHDRSKTYGVWCWINKQSWIDFIFDVSSLVAFSIATWLVLKALVHGA
jgi:hypothetical protein